MKERDMNERELGKALLRGEEPVDLQSLTDRVLRHDRRRIWLLGIVCVIAWMMVVMLPWATILPMLAKIGQFQAVMHNSSALSAADQQRLWQQASDDVREATIVTFVDSIISMFLAAIFTVLFVVYSRRATLRQLNARLREISVQLKMLANMPK